MATTNQAQLKKFMARKKRKPRPSDAYVSQGRAVENVANTQRANSVRSQAELTASQQRMRHALGYDKPGITAKSAKRKAKKAYHKLNPWD